MSDKHCFVVYKAGWSKLTKIKIDLPAKGAATFYLERASMKVLSE